MKKVATLSEYKDLLRHNKEDLRHVDTNCYLMSSVMNEYIAKECLWVEKYSKGLVFLVDEGCYFNLYYFWESGSPLPNLKQEKPVMIEELNNNGSRDVYLSQFEPLLMRAGFSLFKHNLQVVNILKESEVGLKEQYVEKFKEKIEYLETQGFRIEQCVDEMCMEKVVSLWESALESTDIPHAHKTLSSDSKVVCIFDRENTLCAAKWWRHNGKTSEGRHVVTHKDFGRRGLGSTLQLAWLVDGLDYGVERYMTWIADTNKASNEMHKKAGFICNGRSSNQYILK